MECRYVITHLSIARKIERVVNRINFHFNFHSIITFQHRRQPIIIITYDDQIHHHRMYCIDRVQRLAHIIRVHQDFYRNCNWPKTRANILVCLFEMKKEEEEGEEENDKKIATSTTNNKIPIAKIMLKLILRRLHGCNIKTISSSMK